ncbi:cell cycle checkpoint protein RAD1 [Scaptodrosophila lebanonensis]|uniref:Cell cycle checkpoint protein RAD1 n=1 Tax=Drosophila lebanonensis TaxID=7225 RepID=A0A6J2TCW9_DROLE|nr:cell cycle checkpoint protein RAD1 [Scaptodrosophila lebanonensis]
MYHSKKLHEKGIIRNRKMLTQSQYGDYKFVGHLDHIKTFHACIKSLCFGENGTVTFSEEGLRITVEQGKSIQATLFMDPKFFAEYHVKDLTSFGLKLNVFAECLSLFGVMDCSVKMLYKGDGAPLIVLLEPHNDDDVSTECAIKTLHVDEPIEYELDENSASLNVIFMRGPDLFNIFNELDKAAEELEFTLSPQRPHFKIATVGVVQAESTVEVAKSSDMILLFNCRDTTVARYKSQQLRLMNKALQAATKVAIKTDASGLLEMHFMMQSGDAEEIYVQFFLTPLLDI